MIELLPISIQVDEELIKKFVNINSVKNKLEAQFNFQTLTANWYGDEDNILAIFLYLEGEESFLLHKAALNEKSVKVGHEVVEYSDDVVSCFYQKENEITTYVAITPSELDILSKSPKVLATLLQTKLLKVLNLTAKKLALPLLQY